LICGGPRRSSWEVIRYSYGKGVNVPKSEGRKAEGVCCWPGTRKKGQDGVSKKAGGEPRIRRAYRKGRRASEENSKSRPASDCGDRKPIGDGGALRRGEGWQGNPPAFKEEQVERRLLSETVLPFAEDQEKPRQRENERKRKVEL